MRRLLSVLGAAALAAAAAAGAVTAPASAATTQAGPSCVVNYTVVEASFSYFYAETTVTFSGFPAGQGWQLSFTFGSAQQQILVLQNDQWSQNGENVVITNQSQATTGAGSAQVGFLASYDYKDDPVPVNFTFDGVACTTAQ